MPAVTAEQIRQRAEDLVTGSGDSWSSTADCRCCSFHAMYWCASGQYPGGGYEVARLKVVAHVLDKHTDRAVGG